METPAQVNQPLSSKLSMIDHCLVVGMLTVRLIEGVLRFVLPDQPQWADQVQWVYDAYYASTYLLVALFIFRHRLALAHFHFTGLSIVLFIIAPVADPAVHALFGYPLSQAPFFWPVGLTLDIPTIIISLILAGALWIKRSEVCTGRDSSWWLILAVIIAMGVAFPVKWLTIPANPLTIERTLTPGILAAMLVSQLAKAAAMEEPVFRGILWGYLSLRGWTWKRILIIQTILFWIPHISNLNLPVLFWIWAPLYGLIFGLIAWRSRSIATTMLSHTVTNTIGRLSGLFKIFAT